jgi:hypothetical protein
MFEAIKANPIAYIQCMEQVSRHFKTNHIMITAGMDFAWQFAEVHYQFFDNVTDFYAHHK